MDSESKFVKIVVDIPDGDLGVFGEGLWAKPLGSDLYEVQNSPWHSREINYADIVKAIAPSEDKNPVFVSIERRSGHKTIQIILLEEGQVHKDEILKELAARGASYENANGKLFALDFSPGVDWALSRAYLDDLFEKDWVEYRWSAY